MNKYVAGAIAGAIATAPMTLTMVALNRLVPPGERLPLPPREITMNIAEDIGVKRYLDEEEEITGATLAAHFAYGAAAGALYAPMRESVETQTNLSPAAGGVAFGLTVWTVSYLGWLPAADILHSATKHPLSRSALMIAAHVVWGATLGRTLEELNRDSSNRS